MKTVKITKLSDDVFNGSHPNGIDEGYESEGYEYAPPQVGERYHGGGLLTSTVTEVIDENTFKTRNSTYRIETIEE